jgi:hypothetical protein
MEPLDAYNPNSYNYSMETMNEYIVVLPRAHKKQKTIQYYCTLCKCGLGDALVNVHLDGIKHVWRLKVEDILSMLQQHGIGTYICRCSYLYGVYGVYTICDLYIIY